MKKIKQLTLILLVSIYACKPDKIVTEELPNKNFVIRTIQKQELLQEININTVVTDLQEYLSEVKYPKTELATKATGRMIQDTISGIVIDIEQSIHLSTSEGYNAYTFYVLNNTEQGFKDVVLTQREDGTFKEQLIHYDFTPEEEVLFREGNFNVITDLNEKIHKVDLENPFQSSLNQKGSSNSDCGHWETVPDTCANNEGSHTYEDGDECGYWGNNAGMTANNGTHTVWVSEPCDGFGVYGESSSDVNYNNPNTGNGVYFGGSQGLPNNTFGVSQPHVQTPIEKLNAFVNYSLTPAQQTYLAFTDPDLLDYYLSLTHIPNLLNTEMKDYIQTVLPQIMDGKTEEEIECEKLRKTFHDDFPDLASELNALQASIDTAEHGRVGTSASSSLSTIDSAAGQNTLDLGPSIDGLNFREKIVFVAHTHFNPTDKSYSIFSEQDVLGILYLQQHGAVDLTKYVFIVISPIPS